MIGRVVLLHVEIYYKSFRIVSDVFEVSGHLLLSVQSESTLSQWLHQVYTIIYMSAVMFCETRNTSVRQKTMGHARPGHTLRNPSSSHVLESTILLGHNGRCITDRGRYPTRNCSITLERGHLTGRLQAVADLPIVCYRGSG